MIRIPQVQLVNLLLLFLMATIKRGTKTPLENFIDFQLAISACFKNPSLTKSCRALNIEKLNYCTGKITKTIIVIYISYLNY